MKSSEKDKWLDEVISRMAAVDKPVPNFEKWRQDHPKAVEALKLQAKRHTRRREKTIPAVQIWRMIMKSKTTKFAAAAVVIAVVVLSISLWDKSIPAAYAIEQTIEAFEKVNSVYVEYTSREKGTLLTAKIWARRGSDGKFFLGDFRQESSHGDTIVANEKENLTYCYYPSTKKVYIYEGLTVTIGSFLDINFFSYLQEEMKDLKMEYGKDKVTGKEIVSLSFKSPEKYHRSVSKCGVIIFDLESKLPYRMKLWDNPDFKGEPCLEWTSIGYNPKLSEDTFKFEIPEDAKVIKDQKN
jgi:outer membrane lipoprotein-sorting protein